jgi:hypothetical protein
MMSGTEKARVGISMEINIQAIGSMTRKKVKAFSLGLMVTYMR